MKKYLSSIPTLLFCAGILFSCKKDSTPTPKDYTASIKDKTWSGAITYTGKTTEYYAVHFKANNTLEWAQLSGIYTGHWIINGKELTLTFDGNTVQITADISDDSTLMNIIDNTGVYEVNSGRMIADPGLPLDYTVWKGTRTNTVTGTILPYEMNFITGSTFQIKLANIVIGTSSYTRSGATIRAAGGFFGTLMSTGEMKGSDTNSAFTWHATKQ
jgi:hypothetical protein